MTGKSFVLGNPWAQCYKTFTLGVTKLSLNKHCPVLKLFFLKIFFFYFRFFFTNSELASLSLSESFHQQGKGSFTLAFWPRFRRRITLCKPVFTCFYLGSLGSVIAKIIVSYNCCNNHEPSKLDTMTILIIRLLITTLLKMTILITLNTGNITYNYIIYYSFDL